MNQIIKSYNRSVILVAKEARNANVVFNKSGGNASKNSYTARLIVPSKWMKQMNVTAEDRGVIIEYDDEKDEITVRKGQLE